MSKKDKPRCDLSDEQEYALRKFIDDCVTLNIGLPQEVFGLIFDRMGYKVIQPGTIVRKDLEIKYIFGDPDPFRNIVDEYAPDGEALAERINGASDSTDTDEASSSEPTEGN